MEEIMAKFQGGAPPRTSMRGQQGQIGSRTSGRSGTRHGTNRGQKQQSQWQSEHEASHTFERPDFDEPPRNRQRWQPEAPPAGNKPSQTQGRGGSARAASAEDYRYEREKAVGRPRKQ